MTRINPLHKSFGFPSIPPKARRTQDVSKKRNRGRTVGTFQEPIAPPNTQLNDGNMCNVLSGLGTSRDKSSHSEYATPTQLMQADCDAMYRKSWIAKKIINTIPGDMLRNWREFAFSDMEDESKATELMDVLRKAEKRLCVRKRFKEAMIWGRLYGGALMVMITDDMDFNDPSSMESPLDPETITEGSLKNILIYDRWRVYASGDLVPDITSVHFGMPEFYTLATQPGQIGMPKIHHTRCIRFGGEELPYYAWIANARWDDSVLQHVKQAMKDCDQTTQGIASMIFEANVDVIKMMELRKQLSQNNGEALVTKRLQTALMAKSFNKAIILDSEDSYEKKNNTFANLDKILDKIFTNLSGACDIPMTRLLGQSASGINATGDNDIRNYYDMLSDKQESQLRPQLEYFDEIFVRSALGDMPDDYSFEFNSLWQISETDKATIGFNNAQRDQIYVVNKVLSKARIAEELKESSTYKTMTSQDIQNAEDAQQAEQDAADLAQQNLNNPDIGNQSATTANSKAKSKNKTKVVNDPKEQDITKN